MSAHLRGLALVALLILPAAVSANGLRARPSYSSYYSYPVYYYYVPAVEPVYLSSPSCQTAPIPMPAPAARGLAQPQSAPPSAGPLNPQTVEPPRQPGVSESRSYFSAYSVAPRPTEPKAAERCQAGFWNLSDQDVTLTVANKSYPLQRGRYVKFDDLPRKFGWRVDGRAIQNENVPATEPAVEIVIRR